MVPWWHPQEVGFPGFWRVLSPAGLVAFVKKNVLIKLIGRSGSQHLARLLQLAYVACVNCRFPLWTCSSHLADTSPRAVVVSRARAPGVRGVGSGGTGVRAGASPRGRKPAGGIGRGGGSGFRDFPGRIPARKSTPRAARPPPPGVRPGRAEGADGTGGWSSFSTTVSGHRAVPSWRPVGGNGVQALSHFCIFFLQLGARDLGIPAFAPPSEPPHARAPGAQMIRMASGSSLAFQRLSRDTPNFILSVRLASGDQGSSHFTNCGGEGLGRGGSRVSGSGGL
eukprot:gene10759-biopygen21339